MDDNFIFDNKDEKGIWKIVLVSVAIILGLGTILGILIGTSMKEDADNCKEVSVQTGINRCDSDKKFKQIIFVIGDTANTRKPVVDEKSIGIISTMYDVEKYGVDGVSYISVSRPDDAPQPFDTNKKGAKKIKDEVMKQIKSSYSTVDGADYLEAIRNAALYAKEKNDTLIYVIGSGLSDTGLLNFAEGDLLFGHSTDEIADAVSGMVDDKKALSGLTILWEGLGDTVAPQASLNVDLKEKEERIYKTVLIKLGLDEKDFKKSKTTTVENEKNENVRTNVKTTSVDNKTLVFEYSNENSELAFKPGTATFKDQAAARAEVLEFVKKHGNSIYTIKPFQSRGMCDGAKDGDLLDSRAEATKQLFIDAGVSAADIRIEEGEIGDANECPNGADHYPVDENVAPMNRKVRISVMRK